MENLCLYKQRWIISYILVSIIITFIMDRIGIDKSIQSGFRIIYLVVHAYIVLFYKTNECKEFKINKEKEICKNLLNINN